MAVDPGLAPQGWGAVPLSEPFNISEMNKSARNFKQQAHELVDQLPENATWYDLMFSAGERYDLEGAYADDMKVAYGGHVAEDPPATGYDPSAPQQES